MRSEPITHVRSQIFTLREPNIDTDQIIPARFLTMTERGALADACFRDWRFEEDGTPNAHPLNGRDPEAARILVAGDNFGCGSSREHAPWALKDFGFDAIITSRAADIFKSNAMKNGLVVCEVDEASHSALLDRAGETAEVDIIKQIVTCGPVSAAFRLEAFARTCLIEGVDPLGYILAQSAAITRFEGGQAA
jgi:3-isopropylmalate/(R)-2-methylmalate dehydratase small subunit